ncbi:hypothetical protein BDP27DRAFT_1422525 [Rhodocollybia butyracea]|uniref:Uncharacterized protein n=1 Tax=Rhodocollybia butyracea TaxID=206335 RepID=A0A9P5PRC9_9AGAR|nr:hypothetical protein BDP27DRAFT_1422525 [Rhodocollybia butyracea]
MAFLAVSLKLVRFFPTILTSLMDPPSVLDRPAVEFGLLLTALPVSYILRYATFVWIVLHALSLTLRIMLSVFERVLAFGQGPFFALMELQPSLTLKSTYTPSGLPHLVSEIGHRTPYSTTDSTDLHRRTASYFWNFNSATLPHLLLLNQLYYRLTNFL